MKNKNITVEQYMERTFRINLEKRFAAINESTINESVSPQVGLFWCDEKSKRVYGVAEKLRDAEKINPGTGNQFIVHSSSHMDSWKEVKAENPNWSKNKMLDYYQVPRGRAIMRYSPKVKGNLFEVWMCPDLESEYWEDAIMSFYGLPVGLTSFHYDDDHYTMDGLDELI